MVLEHRVTPMCTKVVEPGDLSFALKTGAGHRNWSFQESELPKKAQGTPCAIPLQVRNWGEGFASRDLWVFFFLKIKKIGTHLHDEGRKPVLTEKPWMGF